jgi:hypothetical protein
VFAVFNLAFIPVVYLLYPETANRTLEDLDDYFDRSSPHRTIIRIGDKVAKQHHRPAEAIEAERRRVESANFSTKDDAVKGGKQYVEHVEVAGEWDWRDFKFWVNILLIQTIKPCIKQVQMGTRSLSTMKST